MAEEERFDPDFKRSDCREQLKRIEGWSPDLAAGIRKRLGVLGVDDARKYLYLIARLVSAMSDAEREACFNRVHGFDGLSDLAQVRLMRRALADKEFHGISSDFIRKYYGQLRETVDLLEELGSTDESRALAHLARCILSLVAVRYLAGTVMRIVRVSEKKRNASTPRPCIRPPGEGGKPVLRLIKSRH